MGDDKKDRGEPDRSLVNPNEPYEVSYFRDALKKKNPFISANITDDELKAIMATCFDELAPSRDRTKLTTCVVTKAEQITTRKIAGDKPSGT